MKNFIKRNEPLKQEDSFKGKSSVITGLPLLNLFFEIKEEFYDLPRRARENRVTAREQRAHEKTEWLINNKEHEIISGLYEYPGVALPLTLEYRNPYYDGPIKHPEITSPCPDDYYDKDGQFHKGTGDTPLTPPELRAKEVQG